VDGIRMAKHTLVTPGITIDGTKIPLALGCASGAAGHSPDPGGDRRRQGTAPRGPRRVRPPIIQRLKLHNFRNVTGRLPDALASTVANQMRRAYHLADPR
jgi:hypothetical protein